MTVSYQALAEKSIAGGTLTRDESRAVLECPDGEVPDLLAAAYRVRRTFCGDKVHIHVLMNAKSGLCPEDCGYCSQSKLSTAAIAKYPTVSEERLLEGARKAKTAMAKRFCIVTSGRGPTDREVAYLAGAVRRIVDEVGIKVCVSCGLLTEEKARTLREAGVDQLNHNLNTSERYHPSITTTHTYQDRMTTLRAARKAGLNLCTGGIFGMGETADDIIDVFLALRDLDVQSIPVNFLHPIKGTPLQDMNYLTPYQCLRILCLARFLNPKQEIRVSGGRELHLRALQPLALYPANSVFTEGYLTTPGQGWKETAQMIRDMGFEIETGTEAQESREVAAPA
ncbi:MAG: biotin synthase BioB [Chloroflexi bacterium]|nr:biotin synthase BioB [Chloroflexota bacterium]